MKKIILIAITLLFAISCNEEEPDYLLDEETYIKVFAELAIIDQYDPTLLQNKTKEDLREIVYETYNINPEDFTRSHNYYQQNVDEQIERIEKLNTLIREERNRIDEFEREGRKRLMPSPDSVRQRLGMDNLPPDSVSM